MADYPKLKSNINEFGLKIMGQRDLPLFSLSCLGETYFSHLENIMGVSYNGLVAFGSENKFQAMLNEEDIVNKIKKTLDLDRVKKETLPFVKNLTEEVKMNLGLLRYLAEKDPSEFLNKIIEIYPVYFSVLAVYNCFLRFIGNDFEVFPKELFEEIAREREQVAKIYPEIENMIAIAFVNYGQKNNFDGTLLKSLTLSELKNYLKTKFFSEETLKVIEKRRKGYIFSLINNEEEVIYEEETVLKFKEEFLSVKDNISEIKGFSVSSGKVRGIAYNSEKSKKISELENIVFVASMTRPGDTCMLKKCLAIITDEGGILSHAAIFAREFKIPCIVGTKIATKAINTGDFLEVDADNGIIKIVEKIKILISQ